VSTPASDRERHIVETVRAFDQRLGLTEASRPFADLVANEQRHIDGHLVLDDFSDIPFLDNIVGVEHYQLRAWLRCDTGDACMATCPSFESYEAYNREQLQLGSPTFIAIEPGGQLPVAVSLAAMEDENFQKLTAFVERTGNVRLAPYMSIGDTWVLARKLSSATGAPIDVVGPPPPVTAFANDKAHLTSFANALAQPVFGRDAMVPTRIANQLDRIAEDLIELFQVSPEVALKMPRCASAMGNYILREGVVEALEQQDVNAVKRVVSSVLEEKQWNGQEDVLSVAWLDTDCSPSTQCWIPPLGGGEPTVDGVYEQLLVGPEKVFLGAVPANLPQEHIDWMTELSLLIVRGYQKLGYVGRCSFDFIVHEGTPYLVECNGRWGGTSIPMQLVDRLFGNPRPAYRARDYISESLVGMDFSELQRRLGDSLYDRRTGRGRFIVYNVGCLKPFGKFDVIALGDTVESASVALETDLPRLLGEEPGQGSHG
jgi:hypothetical protein